MKYRLHLLWIVLIILLLVLAAIVIGKPTPADAQGLTTIVASWLRDGKAETMFCQLDADPDELWVAMYIYPWEGGKGYPLVLDLEYQYSKGNCHWWAAEWHPGSYGIYHADTYVSKGGGNLIYEHDAAKYVRLWYPMIFTGGGSK